MIQRSKEKAMRKSILAVVAALGMIGRAEAACDLQKVVGFPDYWAAETQYQANE